MGYDNITLPSYQPITVHSPICLPVLFLRCNLIKLQAGIIKIFLDQKVLWITFR